MSFQKVVAEQYREKVRSTYQRFRDASSIPPEGWLRTVRKGLGMSGRQLADRLGVTRDQVSKVELREPSGSVTLKSMQNIAEAMNCRFVYAVIPNAPIDELIDEQALHKAELMVRSAAGHMALEAQSLSKAELRAEVERIAKQMIDEMPADLWNRS